MRIKESFKNISRSWQFIIGTLLISACYYSGCSENKNSDSVVIACSSNMQFVIKELIDTFQRQNSTQFDIRIGSSGKLLAQLHAGAKFDLYIPADSIYAFKASTQFKPTLLCTAELCVWSETKDLGEHLNDLSQLEVTKLALPNPKVAPFGRAAKESLQRSGYWNSLQAKCVYGESISDVNNLIKLQTVDLAFTCSSSKNRIQAGHWSTVSPSLYNPLKIYTVKLDSTNNALKEFYLFLHGSRAAKILDANHYKTSVQ